MGQLEIQCFHNVLIYPISVTRDSIRFYKEMEGLLHRVKNSVKNSERVSKVLYGVMYFSPWPYSIPSYRSESIRLSNTSSSKGHLRSILGLLRPSGSN